RQQVLCLTRTHAGHGDHHVYHGNRDLWLFLARGAHQPDCSYRKRRERHQRREPRADESLCYSSCDAHLQFLSLLEVADAAAPVGTITSSPARSPAVTSTRSPDDAPRRAQRSSSPFEVRSVTPERSPWRMTAFTGTTSALREPAGSSSVAALPARKSRVEAPVTGFGTSAFTRYRFPPSAGTTPSTVACTLRPSIRVVIDCPRLTPRTAPGAAVADMRSCDASCRLTSGAPGAANAPASTKRRVTVPANGARMVAYAAAAPSSPAAARAASSPAAARASPVSTASSCAFVAALSS